MALLQFILKLLATQLLVAHATAQSIPAVWEPNDVVTHFCARWYHQSVVKNNTIFIQGGVQTFNIPGTETNSSNSTLGYNEFLLQVDLKDSWDWKTNLSYVSLPELPNPITGTQIRNGTMSGALYHGPYGDPSIYSYGGTTFRGNESFPSSRYKDDYPILHSDQYPLWSFNNETQMWDQYDIKQPWTPSYGAAAEAPDQGLAFYLNGRTDNGTSYSTRYSGDVQTLLDGMIVIDMEHHTSRNLSSTGIKDYQPRVGGTMQYTPGIGDNGLLVAFGGLVYDGKTQTSSADIGRTLGFDTIDVFDIASYLADPTTSNGTWYSQATSGDIPPPRIDFCTAIASAPDNSTHNIYLYAGRDPKPGNDTIYYDDIYVLSLPSFTWVKVFQGRSPRWGHTCHIVGRQMITLGGRNRTPNKCDWEKKGIAVLDLSTMVWGSVFNAGNAIYELSEDLVGKFGGSSKGGATRKTPENGWTSKEFGHIMSKTRIYSNENGTLSVTSGDSESGLDPQTRTAIIAGVTVTFVVLVACISWLVYIYRIRYKHDRLSKINTRSSEGSSISEAVEKAEVELSPEEKKIYEMSGIDGRFESPDTAVPYEADRGNAVTYMVELPATNFSERGRWGVPIIRVPSPSRSRGRSRARSTSEDADQRANDALKKDVDNMV